MLSKFVYRFLTVFAFALFTQMGISQNYVDVDEAVSRLETAIADLSNDLAQGPVFTGQLQALEDKSNDRIQLQLMRSVKADLQMMKSVEEVMTSWDGKASSESNAARKTKLILAIDKVKELLS